MYSFPDNFLSDQVLEAPCLYLCFQSHFSVRSWREEKGLGYLSCRGVLPRIQFCNMRILISSQFLILSKFLQYRLMFLGAR